MLANRLSADGSVRVLLLEAGGNANYHWVNIPIGYLFCMGNPLATEAGRSILQAGGSAVDAAIAVQMVLTLVEPQSSGIGGGAFLVHANDKGSEAFDGRETAPASATST